VSIISYGLSLALGVLFSAAALDKVIHFQEHLDKVKDYQLIKHPQLLLSLSALLLMLEVFVAVSFLAGWATTLILLTAAALQVVYMGFISISLLRGNRRIACGCGGLLNSSVLSWWLIVRNGFFLLAILAIHVFKGTRISESSDVGFIFIAALTIFFFLIMQNMIRTETERA
jgi:Methylamine utilisation protein MauE